MRVTSDQGVEEEETPLGRFCRTLKLFRTEIFRALVSHGVVVLSLYERSKVVSCIPI